MYHFVPIFHAKLEQVTKRHGTPLVGATTKTNTKLLDYDLNLKSAIAAVTSCQLIYETGQMKKGLLTCAKCADSDYMHAQSIATDKALFSSEKC